MSSDENSPGSDDKPHRYVRKRMLLQDSDVDYGSLPDAAVAADFTGLGAC